MAVAHIRFKALEDDYELGGTLFTPASGSTLGPAVLISCATGVRASFYHAYAEYLAQQGGCLVMTYDYRGLGDSRGDWRSLADAAIFPHWARRDHAGALRALRERACARNSSSNSSIVVIGHSVGAHVSALLPIAKGDGTPFLRAFFVSANTAYWRWLRPKFPGGLQLFMHVIPRFAGAVYGRFPSSAIGLGDDLPLRAGQQWAAWARNRDYFCHEDRDRGSGADPIYPGPEARRAAARFNLPTLSLSFADDELVSDNRGFTDFLSMLTGAPRVYWIHMKRAGRGQPRSNSGGHVGFFRPPCDDASRRMWAASLAWVVRGDTHAFDEMRRDADAHVDASHGEHGGGFAWSDSVAHRAHARL